MSLLTISTARLNFSLSSSVGCTSLVPPPHPDGPPLYQSRSSLCHAMLVSNPYMSSLPGGNSVGIDFRMLCSSSTRAVLSVSESVRETDFGAASWSSGVPLGRRAEAMRICVCGADLVNVCIALGVGGAKPPVMPVRESYNHRLH